MCERLESLGCVGLPIRIWYTVADDHGQDRNVLRHCSSQLLDQQLQPHSSEGAWLHFCGSSGRLSWRFTDAELTRPDPLDSSICCRQCLLSWVLLFIGIYQQSVLALAIWSAPWQRWIHHASRPEIACDWTWCRIHGTLLHH
jgi:hypothetical protein